MNGCVSICLFQFDLFADEMQEQRKYKRWVLYNDSLRYFDLGEYGKARALMQQYVGMNESDAFAKKWILKCENRLNRLSSSAGYMYRGNAGISSAQTISGWASRTFSSSVVPERGEPVRNAIRSPVVSPDDSCQR